MKAYATQADLDAAVDALAGRDPHLAALRLRHGQPSLRRMPPGVASLLRIVTDQLISLKAAAAIWQRIETAFPGLQAGDIAAAPEAQLRSLGLSGAKARSFRAIATAAAGGALDLDALARLADDEVLRQLTALRGIGPWTAQIYLLMALGRSDGFPAEDLALQIAAQDLLLLPERPTPRRLADLAEAWRPWRGAAAHLLWRHYRDLKSLPPA